MQHLDEVERCVGDEKKNELQVIIGINSPFTIVQLLLFYRLCNYQWELRLGCDNYVKFTMSLMTLI